MHMILPGWRPKHEVKHGISSCGASNRNEPHERNSFIGEHKKKGAKNGRNDYNNPALSDTSSR